jgi:hypothetical protein
MAIAALHADDALLYPFQDVAASGRGFGVCTVADEKAQTFAVTTATYVSRLTRQRTP